MITDGLIYYRNYPAYGNSVLDPDDSRNLLNQRTGIPLLPQLPVFNGQLSALCDGEHPIIPVNESLQRPLGLTPMDLFGYLLTNDRLALEVLHLNNQEATSAELLAQVIDWEYANVHTETDGRKYQFEPYNLAAAGGRTMSQFASVFNTADLPYLKGADGS